MGTHPEHFQAGGLEGAEFHSHLAEEFEVWGSALVQKLLAGRSQHSVRPQVELEAGGLGQGAEWGVLAGGFDRKWGQSSRKKQEQPSHR